VLATVNIFISNLIKEAALITWQLITHTDENNQLQFGWQMVAMSTAPVLKFWGLIHEANIQQFLS